MDVKARKPLIFFFFFFFVGGGGGTLSKKIFSCQKKPKQANQRVVLKRPEEHLC